MIPYQKGVSLVSATLPFRFLNEMLRLENGRIVWADTHTLYPADGEGFHLGGFFNINPVARNLLSCRWIASDILEWAEKENIECDIVLAPANPAIEKLVWEVARALRSRYAFLKYVPTGRFGEELVEGEILRHDRVLVFNGAVLVGGCVGKALPEFAESLGGEVVGAACFARGTHKLVKKAEAEYGAKFYSTIQVEIPVYKKDTCPKCQEVGGIEILQPWTDLV